MQAAIQIGTELKTVVANVLQPGGQFQLTGKLAILERTAIPILLLPVPQPFQRRGQGECPRERLAVYESTGIDIRHTLRNSQRTGKVLAASEWKEFLYAPTYPSQEFPSRSFTSSTYFPFTNVSILT